jgi:ribose 5-phosphate isomerase A
VATARLAEQVGIPIDGLDGQPLDLAVDGADEIGPGLDLIKGLGGAHLREKVVAARARRFVVIADDSKLVPAMGSRSPVPLEVAEFGLPATAAELEDHGEPILRVHEGRATMTDNGNPIIDLWTGQIADPEELDARLNAIPGVLATGLFIAMAELAIVAGDDGLLYLDRTHQG